MRKSLLAAGLAAAFLLPAALDPAARAQTLAYGEPGARGLAGSTYTTGRVAGASSAGDLHLRGPAGAVFFRDPRFQNRLLPCDAPAALEQIRGAFAEKETRFWNSPLAIAGFDRVRLVRSNPWGQNNIPRRFCTARAHLSDGRVRTVSYAILEDQGTIGWSWGVEWCVHGLDRGRSFDPACRMARY